MDGVGIRLLNYISVLCLPAGLSGSPATDEGQDQDSDRSPHTADHTTNDSATLDRSGGGRESRG